MYCVFLKQNPFQHQYNTLHHRLFKVLNYWDMFKNCSNPVPVKCGNPVVEMCCFVVCQGLFTVISSLLSAVLLKFKFITQMNLQWITDQIILFCQIHFQVIRKMWSLLLKFMVFINYINIQLIIKLFKWNYFFQNNIVWLWKASHTKSAYAWTKWHTKYLIVEICDVNYPYWKWIFK